ncbi:DUF1572 family protein [Portibacter marinus]|uniref:DUF1572 family protein n=1 Tax=Portibacter marinus TaxID=2898660 RepID=UPI001F3A1B2B|nr:DUF1572 family protein [Portibacter marinus]
MENRYLEGIKKQFYYYKTLGERTFDQLEDHYLFTELSPSSHSIALIVQHLSGNMKSRFTDFLTTDGEKEWRNRDQEFVPLFRNRDSMEQAWTEGWSLVFQAIDQIKDIKSLVYIRNQEHTVYEALNRQLAHYAYHIGQIVYIGKSIKGDDWVSLSIAKGASKHFNESKFTKGKHKGHFTDKI